MDNTNINNSRLAADWATRATLYLTKAVRVGGTYSSNGPVWCVYNMVFIKPEETPGETKVWIRG
jgi:hypothetical protein